MADDTTLTAELAARGIKAMTSANIDAAGGDPTARATIAALQTSLASVIARVQALENGWKITISGTPPTTGQVGQAYNFLPSTSNGSGTKTFTLSAGTLLGGLSFSTSTGAITGTPTVVGTMSGLVITVTDSTGSASTAATTVTIAAAATTPMKIAAAGSSTPQHAFTLYGSTDNSDPRVTSSDTGANFVQLDTGRFGQRIGKKLADAFGRNVQFVTRGAGGTTLAGWEANSNNLLTNLTNAMKAAGGVDCLWLQVGWNDINTGVPTSKAAHLALLRSLISKIRSGSGQSNLMIFIGITQDKSFTPEVRYVRQAEMTIINNDPFVRIFCNQSDLLTNDGVHVQDTAYDTFADRAFLQLAAFFSGSAQVRGPRTVGAARVTDTTTDVTFQHGNGNDFTPTSGALGFSVYDSSGAQVTGTVTGARVSPTVVRVAHPTGVSKIDFYTNPLTSQAGQSDPNALKDNGAVPLLAEPSEDLLAVSGATVTPVTISGTPGPMTSGSAYSFVPTTSGGDGGKVFSFSGSLPSGLVFSTATGSITAAAGNTVPSGNYSGTITVTSGGTSATLNVTIAVSASGGGTPTYSATGKSAQMNYGGDNVDTNPAVAGWNNRKVSTNATATSVVTPAGANTGWTDYETVSGVPSASGGAANTGATTGNNSGVYPDAVMTSYWFHQSDTPANHVFGGLDDAKAYDVTLFSSRATTGRFTAFTINGNTQTLDASNNTTQTVTFAKVRPSGGVINVGWGKGAINGTASGFAYLNAAVVTEYSIT